MKFILAALQLSYLFTFCLGSTIGTPAAAAAMENLLKVTENAAKISENAHGLVNPSFKARLQRLSTSFKALTAGFRKDKPGAFFSLSPALRIRISNLAATDGEFHWDRFSNPQWQRIVKDLNQAQSDNAKKIHKLFSYIDSLSSLSEEDIRYKKLVKYLLKEDDLGKQVKVAEFFILISHHTLLTKQKPSPEGEKILGSYFNALFHVDRNNLGHITTKYDDIDFKQLFSISENYKAAIFNLK